MANDTVLPQVPESAIRLLGFAARSRKLLCGASRVLAQITSKEPPTIVIIAADASARTRKQLTDKCRYRKIPVAMTSLTGDELAATLGSSASVMAASPTDRSICAEILKSIEEFGGDKPEPR